jgi:DNA-binding NtrC family response regulator
MKKDVTELKRMFLEILQNPNMVAQNQALINELKESDGYRLKGNDQLPAIQVSPITLGNSSQAIPANQPVLMNNNHIHDHVEVEESLNIMDKEKELIVKALKKHKSKRKDAALDLGISERTLYRKLKEYDIEE